MKIGFHASHEVFGPSRLVHAAELAEDAGFDAIMCSDHFAPWGKEQGQSGFNWSWLGAAMQATTRIPFGTLAVPVGLRYHPAIVAQAAATVAEMFPGRLPWVAAGSGEALNERAVGLGWPSRDERQIRLRDGVAMMRRLFNGETVEGADGPLRAEEAKLWTLPKQLPRIYAAALSEETAAFVASWADGLLVAGPPEEVSPVIRAFRRHGGENKPVVLQLHFAWARNEDDARRDAHRLWGWTAAAIKNAGDAESPEIFDAAAARVMPRDMDRVMLVSADAEAHVENIAQYDPLNLEEIYLHNACSNVEAFIEFFGNRVLPALRNRENHAKQDEKRASL